MRFLFYKITKYIANFPNVCYNNLKYLKLYKISGMKFNIYI